MRNGGDDQVEIDLPLLAALRRPTLGADAFVGDVALRQFDGEAGAAVEAILCFPGLVTFPLNEGLFGSGRRPAAR